VPDVGPEAGAWQFGRTAQIAGPLGLSESAFEARLRSLGVAYRVVDAGLLQAVVPSRAVSPGSVGVR
jgi:hypothetical protein